MCHRSEVPGSVGDATTDIAEGTDADRILIKPRHIKDLCADNDKKRAKAKLILAFTLMNEMVHVYQKFDGNDLTQCDAERDSDIASLKILDAIIDTFATS